MPCLSVLIAVIPRARFVILLPSSSSNKSAPSHVRPTQFECAAVVPAGGSWPGSSTPPPTRAASGRPSTYDRYHSHPGQRPLARKHACAVFVHGQRPVALPAAPPAGFACTAAAGAAACCRAGSGRTNAMTVLPMTVLLPMPSTMNTMNHASQLHTRCFEPCIDNEPCDDEPMPTIRPLLEARAMRTNGPHMCTVTRS